MEESKIEYLYLHVPICLLRHFVADTEKTVVEIIRYGCLTFSKTDKVNEIGDDYFLGQFVYMYFNEQKNLPVNLIAQMTRYEDKGDFANNRNGFSVEGEYDAAEAVSDLKNIVKNDDDFNNEILAFCKFRYAYNSYYKYQQLVAAYEWAKEMEKTIPEKTATVMISYFPLLGFLSKDKTEKEKMRFAVYMGICSILGKKPHYLTNKDLIFARAFGYNSVAEVTAANPELWQKYNTRRRIITMLEQLTDEKRIVFYTAKNMRGIHVGYFKKISFRQLVENVQSKKMDNSMTKKRQVKKEIERQVIEKLREEKGLTKSTKNVKSNGASNGTRTVNKTYTLNNVD